MVKDVNKELREVLPNESYQNNCNKMNVIKRRTQDFKKRLKQFDIG